MKMSVIILTYNRSDLLKRCLNSLLVDQTSLPDEVIIVNSGQEDVYGIIKDYAPAPPIKIVKTDNVSLSSNRNIGINASSFELVAFTDDDCEVSHNWVETFRKVYTEENNIGSAGGRVLDVSGDRLSHRLDEIRMTINDYYSKRNAQHCYYFQTSNVCYSREAIRKVNFFDENITRKSAEDLSIGLKLLLAGYKNKHCPENFVMHYGRTTSTLTKRLFSYGRDLYKVMNYFKGTRLENAYKTNNSIFYLIFSIVAGSFREAGRFRKKENFFSMWLYCFIIKFFINTGILYERLFKK